MGTVFSIDDREDLTPGRIIKKIVRGRSIDELVKMV